MKLLRILIAALARISSTGLFSNDSRIMISQGYRRCCRVWAQGLGLRAFVFRVRRIQGLGCSGFSLAPRSSGFRTTALSFVD